MFKAIARAHRATHARVEAESAGLIAAFTGFRYLFEQLANGLEGAGVADRVGACRFTDGRLINQNDICYVFGTFN